MEKKYYFYSIVYFNEDDCKLRYVNDVSNDHPFVVIKQLEQLSYQFIPKLLNWKEISKEEFILFKSVLE